LDFTVIDGGETITVSNRAKGKYFFALTKEADFRGNFMADLNEALVSGKRHY
jgi:hypothetical protein